MQFMGSEPIFVVEFQYEAIHFCISTVELPAEIFPVPIYGLVQKFNALTVAGDIAGFGAVSNIGVECDDAFGIFKGLLRSMNPRAFTVNLWLVVTQPPHPYDKVLLLSGRMSTPAQWKEGDRTFSFEIVQNLNYLELGFEPDFGSILHLNNALIRKPWPIPFGNPALTKMEAICSVPDIQLSKNVVFFAPGFAYNDPEQTTPIYPPVNVMDGYTDDQDNRYVGAGNFLNWPIADMTVAPSGEGFKWVDITYGDGKIRAYGTFTTVSGQPVFSCNPTAGFFNVPWYENIVIDAPVQFTQEVPFQRDSASYRPNTAKMLGFGTWVGYNGRNIHGDLFPVTDVTTEFPIVSTSSSTQPWIKDTYVLMRVWRLTKDSSFQESIITRDLWAKITVQADLTLHFDEDSITDIYGQRTTMNGFRPAFILHAIQNKIFQPYTQDFYPRPKIAMPVERFEIFERPDDSGILDLAFVVPAGSGLVLKDWWANLCYPISQDIDTNVNGVYGQINGRQVELSPYTDYQIWRYTREDGFLLHQGPVSSGPDPYMELLDPLAWPRKFTFIKIVNPSVFDYLERDIRVIVINGRNSDELTFKWVIDNYTSHTGEVNPDITNNHPCNFWLNEKTQVADFLGRLAYEHAKAVSLGASTAKLVDLLNPPDQVHVFNEGSIGARSLIATYTDETQIKNKIRVTANWAPGQQVIRDADSIALYTELVEDYQVATNKIYDTFIGDPYDAESWTSGYPGITARGYNRVLYWWLNQKAHVWTILAFDSFLDSLISLGRLLQPNDYVDVQFGIGLNHTSLGGIPLAQNPQALADLFPSRELISSTRCLIQEMSIDPNTWTVAIKVRAVNNKIGEW